MRGSGATRRLGRLRPPALRWTLALLAICAGCGGADTAGKDGAGIDSAGADSADDDTVGVDSAGDDSAGIDAAADSDADTAADNDADTAADSDADAADTAPPTCASDQDCAADQRCVGASCVDALQVWPNAASAANSDPWLASHHAQIVQLRPRILALNFVNAKSNAQMLAHLDQLRAAIVEMSRPRGDVDAAAPPMWRPEIAYAIDLRDQPAPKGWPYGNSSHYPREDPKDGVWGFDYEALFTSAFAAKMAIADPDAPGKVLDLCALIDRGLVHEIWVYGDADVPGDVNAAEILERKPRYDAQRVRLVGEPMDVCAGNGCFDVEDTFPASCDRTIRVAWVNHSRGPGCFLESLSHGFESVGTRKPALIPTLSAEFPAFGNFDLDAKHGTWFPSWYSCPYGVPCLSYPSDGAVSYDLGGGQTQTLQGYDPVCGNAHFAPNGKQHYDLQSDATVQTSCRAFRQGGGADGSDAKAPFMTADFAANKAIAPDCMGPFLVWWWQQIPGVGTKAQASGGGAMLPWLPFLYY